MVSLYTRLYSYRQREKRNPLEDFLTAALADLLNRLSSSAVVKFVSEYLLSNEEARTKWQAYVNSQGDFSFCWETQKFIRIHGEIGYIDLVLYINGSPVVVVESKIYSPIRKHFHEKITCADPAKAELENEELVAKDEKSPDEQRSQLHTYGLWLNDHVQRDADVKRFGGALVYLTHRSPAPKDFSEFLNYSVGFTNEVFWTDIASWATRLAMVKPDTISQHTGKKIFESPVVAVLADELVKFLKDKKMLEKIGPTMNWHDLAALEVFLTSQSTIENTMAFIAKHLKSNLPEIIKYTKTIEQCNFQPDSGIVWGWFYLEKEGFTSFGPKGWYISWGIRFPSITSEFWDEFKEAVPFNPCIFCLVCSDNKKIPLENLIPPSGWNMRVTHDPRNALLAVQNIHPFSETSNDWTIEFSHWVETKVQQIWPILQTFV